MGNLVLLIVGGNDTTRNTMSRHRAFDGQVSGRTRSCSKQNPELIPNAVQECIRWQTPLAHMRRTATEDTELFGHQIKKGDKVVLWYLSANRDEEVFDDADKIDIHSRKRPPPSGLRLWYPPLRRCASGRAAICASCSKKCTSAACG